jgi:hypothetical protein
MATWQFDGTVSYLSGKRVAFTAVSLGITDGQSNVVAIFRTDTDLSGRFQATLRDGPAGGTFMVRAFDSWRGKAGDWMPATMRNGSAITADLVLPWEEPEICAINSQWTNTSMPFIDSMLRNLERPSPKRELLALRLLPVRDDGTVYETYPRDPAIERMFTQFQEEVTSATHTHAAMDIARRISDCLLRMGFAKRYDERIDVFKFALQGIQARPREDRKQHIRNLVKTLSMSLRRPFVPGIGAVVELESATATTALVLFTGALLSTGRTDLKLKKEMQSASQLVFQVMVPGTTSR